MPPFGPSYAALYDAMYADKEYRHEIDLISKWAASITGDHTRLVDYGCGTGNHALALARSGFHVTGVDRSEAMLDLCREKAGGLASLDLLNLDQIEQIPAGGIDVWLTLFDVLSYITDHEDRMSFMDQVRRCVRPGGLFVFDFWYGPGVMHLGPERRWKEFGTGPQTYLRLTEPELDTVNSRVHLSQTLYVFNDRAPQEKFTEQHTMQFYWKSEIMALLHYNNFELVHFGTWQEPEKEPDETVWSALVVARAK